MKLLITADLHWDSAMFETERKQAQYLSRQIKKENPDVLVIAGDVFSHGPNIHSPYKILSRYFPDIPVICVPGNHEFIGRSVPEVYNAYMKMYNPNKYNVHYLDICGHYMTNGVKFLGNVLWYDGSQKTIQGQDMWKWADGMWADKYIHDFDPVSLNMRCRDHIGENAPDEFEISVLVTHHVPHRDLNAHITPAGSRFDLYSGMDDLFSQLSFIPDYAVCGHTHKRVLKEIQGIDCINVGNDYFEVKYELIEI